MYGCWTFSPAVYAAEAERYMDEIGMLDFACPQDWMCEPGILKKTGLTVPIHQLRTMINFVTLRELAPRVPWIPVLQGWTLDDYLNCWDLYERAGVDLAGADVVGVGTMCRRQATDEAVKILKRLASEGLKLHGFGFSQRGLAKGAAYLQTADSMAWSYNARKHDPLPGCTHKNCANCLRWALNWYKPVAAILEAPQQTMIAFAS